MKVLHFAWRQREVPRHFVQLTVYLEPRRQSSGEEHHGHLGVAVGEQRCAPAVCALGLLLDAPRGAEVVQHRRQVHHAAGRALLEKLCASTHSNGLTTRRQSKLTLFMWANQFFGGTLFIPVTHSNHE